MRLTRVGLLTAFIVVLALWVGSLVTRLLPDPKDIYPAPFPRTGQVGELVHTRAYDVTVTGVRAGPEVASPREVALTRGVWLVVDLTWSPTQETIAWSPDNAATEMSPAEARIVTPDGRQFGGVPGLSWSCGAAQPGLPLTCSIPFEMPSDALEGAHFLFPSSWVGAMDDVADIDLGIDAAAAADLAASTEQQPMSDPTPAAG